MTTYEVVLTHSAEVDLENIYNYIAEHESEERADSMLERLTSVANGLAHFPDKGSIPIELQSIGIREFRQTISKPYRFIYKIIDLQVIIFIIADGRRDMQTLLTHRLLNQ